jgi:hypothetical protein
MTLFVQTVGGWSVSLQADTPGHLTYAPVGVRIPRFGVKWAQLSVTEHRKNTIRTW